MKYLLMNEQPAAGVHEETALRLSIVSWASNDIADLHLTRGEKVHARDRLVADRHVSTNGVNCQSAEIGEAIEQSAVGCAHGKLHLRKLRKHAKEPHLLLTKQN